MKSGQLAIPIENLATSELPASPPGFDEVVSRVEAIEGVRFRDLFERLPRTAPDGDAAIAAIWQLVAEARQKPAGPDMAKVMEEFEPVLQAIAAAANDENQRPQIKDLLPQLEGQGWRLSDPVHCIWAGERDASKLTDGIDANSAQLVRRILELLTQS
jgi:hypothetical protein